MMQAETPLPEISDLGRALATSNDWRAIVIVLSFVILALICFIIWREMSLVGLRKTFDKIAEALWQLRLTLVEDRALQALEKDRAREGHSDER